MPQKLLSLPGIADFLWLLVISLAGLLASILTAFSTYLWKEFKTLKRKQGEVVVKLLKEDIELKGITSKIKEVNQKLDDHLKDEKIFMKEVSDFIIEMREIKSFLRGQGILKENK